eukprot:1143328-Pelagomonas_calceolata.AAC.15
MSVVKHELASLSPVSAAQRWVPHPVKDSSVTQAGRQACARNTAITKGCDTNDDDNWEAERSGQSSLTVQGLSVLPTHPPTHLVHGAPEWASKPLQHVRRIALHNGKEGCPRGEGQAKGCVMPGMMSWCAWE